MANWGTNGNNGNIQKFDSDGQSMGTFVQNGSGGLAGPVNLWFMNGDLFVSDWTGGDVLRYDGATGRLKKCLSLDWYEQKELPFLRTGSFTSPTGKET